MKYGPRGDDGRELGGMYFPQFLTGMVVTSGALAARAYGATGSLWIAAVWAILTLVLLQVGYFVLVLGIVYGSRDSGRASDAGSSQTASRVAR
ncbi:hypothetical protein FJ414_01625 [Mesorhizobium sp. B3-1-6]|nr:hypothetical protein FJ414_01625 [Mesorhizobium sp. B3-1-6]TPI69625.1 hypothetical protein FJ424_05680 [Mesorhizobium sp. B3-1-8]